MKHGKVTTRRPKPHPLAEWIERESGSKATRNNPTMQHMAETIGVSIDTLYRCVRRKARPHMLTARMVSEYTRGEVTPDQITGGGVKA